MTPDMGTLRQPMVLWVPLPRPASDDKGNSNNNTEPPPHVLLCSDGAFAGNAFADMDALACFLGDPMAYVRECFYERGHELTERLLLAKKLTMDPFRLAEGGRSELETAWRRCETWVQFLHFLQTYHWREVCSPAMAQTFSDEARDMLPIAHEQFLAYATPITTTTTTKLPPPPPAAAANAQRREHGVDHGFMEWLRACDASIRWLVEHTTVEVIYYYAFPRRAAFFINQKGVCTGPAVPRALQRAQPDARGRVRGAHGRGHGQHGQCDGRGGAAGPLLPAQQQQQQPEPLARARRPREGGEELVAGGADACAELIEAEAKERFFFFGAVGVVRWLQGEARQQHEAHVPAAAPEQLQVALVPERRCAQRRDEVVGEALARRLRP